MDLSNIDRVVELRARYLTLEELRRHQHDRRWIGAQPDSALPIIFDLTAEELNGIVDRLCRATILALHDLGVDLVPEAEQL